MQLIFLRQRDRERQSWKALGKSWVWKSFFVLSVFVASCFSVGYTRQKSLQGWRSMGWHCLYASKRKWKTSLTQSLPNCRVRRIPSPSVLQHEILLSSSLSHIIDSFCQPCFFGFMILSSPPPPHLASWRAFPSTPPGTERYWGEEVDSSAQIGWRLETCREQWWWLQVFPQRKFSRDGTSALRQMQMLLTKGKCCSI